MKHAWRVALFVGIAVSIAGCKSTQKTSSSGQIERPKGVDHYIQAVELYKKGDRDQAISELIEATRKNPSLIMPRIMLGDMYRDEGKYDDAVKQMERVTRMDPYYSSNWYKLGVGYQLAQKIQDATASYQKALDLKPADAKSHMNLGLIQLYNGDKDKALEYAKKATELDPRNAAAWSNLGITYDARQEYVKGEEAYRKSVDLDPDNPASLANLATNLMAQNKGSEAAEIMKRAVGISNTPALRKRYGDALARAGRYDEAVAQYDQALKLDPKYYPAMNEIGFTRIAEYRKGFEMDESKRNDAVAMWKKSLEVNGSQPKVQAAVKEWTQTTQNLSP